MFASLPPPLALLQPSLDFFFLGCRFIWRRPKVCNAFFLFVISAQIELSLLGSLSHTHTHTHTCTVGIHKYHKIYIDIFFILKGNANAAKASLLPLEEILFVLARERAVRGAGHRDSTV